MTAAVLGSAALAQGTDQPTAIVTMGDSYLSGEASRWLGNSTSELGDRAGTDRAYRGPFDYDVDSIYIDGTNDSGCHRAKRAGQALLTCERSAYRIDLQKGWLS